MGVGEGGDVTDLISIFQQAKIKCQTEKSLTANIGLVHTHRPNKAILTKTYIYVIR